MRGVQGAHLAFAKPVASSLIPIHVTRQILAGPGPCRPPFLTAGVTQLRVLSQHPLLHFWEQRIPLSPEERGSPLCHPALLLGQGRLPGLRRGTGHRLVGHSPPWPLLLLPLPPLPKFPSQHKCPCARVTDVLQGAASPALFSLLTLRGGTIKPTARSFFSFPCRVLLIYAGENLTCSSDLVCKPTFVIFPLFYLTRQIEAKVFTLLVF